MNWLQRIRSQAAPTNNLIAGLGILCLTAVATRPLWATSRWVLGGDALAHLFRVFALDRALRQGVAYPRWLPDLAFGYGYPNLNFYPPLTAYVAETFHLLGLGYADAIKTEFILAIALAAWGAYLFGAEVFSEEDGARAAGLLIAGVYVLAPFFLFDVYDRGGLPEILAMAVLPWLLWSVQQIIQRQRAAAVVLAALLFAVMLLAHSLTLALVTPLIGCYLLYELLQRANWNRARALAQFVVAAVLAAGVAAIHWLPYMTELQLVRMGNGLGSAQETFMGYLFRPVDLIQLSLFYRYGNISLGLVTVVLGVFGFLTALTLGKRRAQGRVLLFGGIAALCALAMTQLMRPLWLLTPVAPMIGFPWRLSQLVDLGLAMAIGTLPVRLPQLIRSAKNPFGIPARLDHVSPLVISVVILGLVAVTSMAKLAPKEMDVPKGDLTLGQLARFEADTGFVGLTVWDEFFPTTVLVPIGYSEPILTGNEPRRAPVDISLVHYGPTRRILAVSGSDPSSITLRTMHFPDWRASIDGVPTATYASTPLGLLTVDLPAGDHHMSLSLEDTPPRQIGAWLTGVSLAILLALTGLVVWRREPGMKGLLVTWGMILPVVLLPAGMALSASARSPQPVRVQVSPALDVIGLNVEGAELASGAWRLREAPSSLQVQVYWHVRDLLREESVWWRLVDDSGRAVFTNEFLPRYGTGFARTWVPNEIVEDAYDLRLDPALPPGRYRLEVAQGAAHSFSSIGTIELERSSASKAAPASIEHRVDARVGDRVHLLGYDGPAVARAGESLSVTTYWRSDGALPRDYTTFVQLWDMSGKRVAQHDSLPGIEVTPMLWPPGDTISVRHQLDLPADLKPGLYELVAGMYTLPDHARLPVVTAEGPSEDSVAVLGQIKVPMQAADLRPDHPRAFSVGSNFRLLGYDLAVRDTTGKLVAKGSGEPLPMVKVSPEQVLDLKLYWQALSRIDADYKVFVHLKDENGRIVAQKDQMPGENQYPTHIWDLGEQVADSYALPLKLPPGRYTILVGMYSPETGERLIARDKDGAQLPERQIEIGMLEVIRP